MAFSAFIRAACPKTRARAYVRAKFWNAQNGLKRIVNLKVSHLEHSKILTRAYAYVMACARVRPKFDSWAEVNMYQLWSSDSIPVMRYWEKSIFINDVIDDVTRSPGHWKCSHVIYIWYLIIDEKIMNFHRSVLEISCRNGSEKTRQKKKLEIRHWDELGDPQWY